MKHLVLRLEAPLMAFGGETIDNYGVIRWFPSASMLTGLLANALGWRRIERKLHQHLQDRLIFAARIDREPAGGVRLQDFQTAAINNKERSWTTRGYPEGRTGGTFQNHLRYRDYWADMCVTIALRLNHAEDSLTLDELAEALKKPARPLFIGRKPCLPSRRLFDGFAEGETATDALMCLPLREDSEAPSTIRLLWPEGEGVRECQTRPSLSPPCSPTSVTGYRDSTAVAAGCSREQSPGEEIQSCEQASQLAEGE